jgi:calcineurin-like phosphoesterase family protein
MACVFVQDDGTKCRPFESAEHQDQVLIENWQKTVKPNDKVYVLGDVAIPRRSLGILAQLNGDKILIRGNHDIFKLADYAKYFRDIRAYHVMDRCLLSHIPVHPSQKGRFRANIHGHTHNNLMEDDWYINVCVEHTNYTPISWEVVRDTVRQREAQKT